MDGIGVAHVRSAMLRVARALETHKDRLTELDQAMGDGDLGITAAKIAAACHAYVAGEPSPTDLGRYLAQAGMALNRAASSSLGTLLATALMRAGKEVRAQSEVGAADLAAAAGTMLDAARAGRDAVTPLRSRVGRSSWVGERTEGLVDPGCEAGVIILEAIVGPAQDG